MKKQGGMILDRFLIHYAIQVSRRRPSIELAFPLNHGPLSSYKTLLRDSLIPEALTKPDAIALKPSKKCGVMKNSFELEACSSNESSNFMMDHAGPLLGKPY